MSSASESTIQALEFIIKPVKPLPVGTNLALLHVLWALARLSQQSGRHISRPVALGAVRGAGAPQQPSGA